MCQSKRRFVSFRFSSDVKVRCDDCYLMYYAITYVVYINNYSINFNSLKVFDIKSIDKLTKSNTGGRENKQTSN